MLHHAHVCLVSPIYQLNNVAFPALQWLFLRCRIFAVVLKREMLDPELVLAVILFTVRLAAATVDCGVEITAGNIHEYEQCSRFTGSDTLLMVIAPALACLLTIGISCWTLKAMAKLTRLGYEVRWNSRYGSLLYREAFSYFGERSMSQQDNDPLGKKVNLAQGTQKVCYTADCSPEESVPVSVSYMHARLRTHWQTSVINAAWTLLSLVVTIFDLIIVQRAGEFWQYIGYVFCILNIIHLAILCVVNLHIVPQLFTSGLRRSIFENLNKIGLNWLVSAPPQGSATLRRSIFYLDQFEQKDWDKDMGPLERSFFIKSYSEAVKASKYVIKSQDSLLQGAGSSAISALLLAIGSVRILDVNGTTASINALSLTFAVAAVAQALSAASSLANGLASSLSASEGIEYLNFGFGRESTWASKVHKEMIQKCFIWGWGLKEQPIRVSDCLDQDYYKKNVPFIVTAATLPSMQQCAERPQILSGISNADVLSGPPGKVDAMSLV